MTTQFFAISILSTGCYLSCCFNNQPVLVGARRFDSIVPLDQSNECGLYSDYILKEIFTWAHGLAKQSFPDMSDYSCAISCPTYTTNAEREKLVSIALDCSFADAVARHSNVAVASLYIPSIIGNINARCLVVCLDGEELSSYITELGDGVHETLAVSRQQLEMQDGTHLHANISNSLELVCDAASLDSRLSLNEDIDYCLLTGYAEEDTIEVVRNKLSEITSISLSAILYESNAIALGNAVVSGVLQGTVQEVLFLDATSHSVFTLFMRSGDVYMARTENETYNDADILCIPRNTTTPTKRTEHYRFIMNKGSSVLAYVYEACKQGEIDFRISTISCFRIDCKQDHEKHVEIEIGFDIDANNNILCNANVVNSQSSDMAAEIKLVSTIELQEIERSNDFIEMVEMVADTCAQTESLGHEDLDALVELKVTPDEVVEEHERTLLLNETETISVMIPAGIVEGTTIKVIFNQLLAKEVTFI
jgi:hypothetical protein